MDTSSRETATALASQVCSLNRSSHEFGQTVLSLITNSDLLETDKENLVAAVQSRVSMDVAQEIPLVEPEGKQVHHYFEQYLRQDHKDSMQAINAAIEPMTRLRFGAKNCSGSRP